jgi:hypothetical protein
MLTPRPHKGHPPESLLDRLERAAAGLNPTLALVAIGLVILNVLVVFSLVIPWGPTYPRPDPAACAGDRAPLPR